MRIFIKSMLATPEYNKNLRDTIEVLVFVYSEATEHKTSMKCKEFIRIVETPVIKGLLI